MPETGSTKYRQEDTRGVSPGWGSVGVRRVKSPSPTPSPSNSRHGSGLYRWVLRWRGHRPGFRVRERGCPLGVGTGLHRRDSRSVVDEVDTPESPRLAPKSRVRSRHRGNDSRKETESLSSVTRPHHPNRTDPGSGTRVPKDRREDGSLR